jgi:hypothetical protein
MNKQGVAIAADSAVTLGNRKAFFNTQKIFPIGDLPFAIVAVGDTQIGRIPIDLIIEGFSSYIKKHQIIKENFFEYKEVLFDYLKGNHSFYKFDEQEIAFAKATFFSIYEHIKDSIIEDNGEFILSSKALQKAYESIQEFFAVSPEFTLRTKNTFNLNYIKQKEKDIILLAYKGFLDERDFEKFPINEMDYEMMHLAEKIFNEYPTAYRYLCNSAVEITMTGFGSSQLFPSVMRFLIHGIVEKQIIYTNIEDDFSIETGYSRTIIMFGQKNVAEAIIDGFSTETRRTIRKALETSLLKNLKNNQNNHENDKDIEDNLVNKIVDEIFQKIDKEMESIWGPIWNSVQHMPLLDMCSFAEGLINIQSLRSRYEADSESNNTVGGPIRVAKITIGQGITWFKKNKGIL